ncbi:hypothetical protein K431DRAFT_87151 [Polychaeton citri CBS 116435]|uniref:Uncharacterized protein n=1 Tax=Polychaeton citri CBS 116435 TaxID=1314669 RepID=A0A9P4UQ83_9PEZI|nr:hypothetical protein K431DRAFT_87151 [Polychaeton citri CBS 116435]
MGPLLLSHCCIKFLRQSPEPIARGHGATMQRERAADGWVRMWWEIDEVHGRAAQRAEFPIHHLGRNMTCSRHSGLVLPRSHGRLTLGESTPRRALIRCRSPKDPRLLWARYLGRYLGRYPVSSAKPSHRHVCLHFHHAMPRHAMLCYAMLRYPLLYVCLYFKLRPSPLILAGSCTASHIIRRQHSTTFHVLPSGLTQGQVAWSYLLSDSRSHDIDSTTILHRASGARNSPCT